MVRVVKRQGRRVIVAPLNEQAMIDFANNALEIAWDIYQVTPMLERPEASEMIGFLVAQLTALIFGRSAEEFCQPHLRHRYQHELHTNCRSLFRLWEANKLTIPVGFPYTVQELIKWLEGEDHDHSHE